MLSEEINDLLSLLALMIFADKQVLDGEVSAFVRLADKLQVARDIEPRLSEAKLTAWYGNNKNELENVLESQDFADWLYSRLDRLNPLQDKLSILSVLCDIASSDGEVHVSERALIKLVAQRWDIAV